MRPLSEQVIEIIQVEYPNTRLSAGFNDRMIEIIGDTADHIVVQAIKDMSESTTGGMSLRPGQLQARLRRSVTTQHQTDAKPYDRIQNMRDELSDLGWQIPDHATPAEVERDYLYAQYKLSLKYYGPYRYATFSKWVTWQIYLKDESLFPDIVDEYITARDEYWNRGKKFGDTVKDQFSFLEPQAELNKPVVKTKWENREAVNYQHPRSNKQVIEIYKEKHHQLTGVK